MKILVLTSIYPALDVKIANNTNVVHYFAYEWVKEGHEVIVVHNYPVYMRIFHWIARFAAKMICSKFNTAVTAVYQNKPVEFNLDGVKVIRLPLYKPFPHFAVPSKVMNRQIEEIGIWCKKYKFIPDIITAHNFYPHIPMVNRLKADYFPNARTCIVVHKQAWKMLRFCGADYKTEIEKIDVFGYRSLPLKREWERYTETSPNSFMCYSGVPVCFLNRKDLCVIKKPISRIIYVGSFIRRKFPEKILIAIKNSSLGNNFTLDYVGDGINRKIIEKLIAENHWEKQVTLHGFVQRNQIPLLMARANLFIMISEEETFGLVYLEAMSMGCIVIASRDEGMEGIIIDGVNGFLCKAGDEKELAIIIDKINMMSQEELNIISDKARATAIRLTDCNVAKKYIENIISRTC
ncbi:MAG: glycosyltransferase [Prevotella sp.]|nr:glycosyltransferase [Prevotella sp.]